MGWEHSAGETADADSAQQDREWIDEQRHQQAQGHDEQDIVKQSAGRCEARSRARDQRQREYAQRGQPQDPVYNHEQRVGQRLEKASQLRAPVRRDSRHRKAEYQGEQHDRDHLPIGR